MKIANHPRNNAVDSIYHHQGGLQHTPASPPPTDNTWLCPGDHCAGDRGLTSDQTGDHSHSSPGPGTRADTPPV